MLVHRGNLTAIGVQEVDFADVLARIERKQDEILETLREQGKAREWYTVAEFADLVGKSSFTVRQWANLGRIYAEALPNGREWRVSHAELERFRKDGLLTEDRNRNGKR